MSYTDTYNPDRYSEIESLLLELSNLEPGGRLTVKAKPQELARTRWLLYDWLYHNRLKPNYKIQTEQDRLTIIKRGAALTISKEREELPEKLDLLLREVIGEADPIKFLQQKLVLGEITSSELGMILEHYTRLMS